MVQVICECGNIFTQNIGSYKKRFCSRRCAGIFVKRHTPESNVKRSLGAQKFYEGLSSQERSDRARATVPKARATYQSNFLAAEFETLKPGTKFRRVMLEQNNCCLKCGLNEWQGEKITLELDHVNGDNKDNSRENLRYLCPNCHSQTPTWRGRNNTGKNNSRNKEREHD